MIREKPKHDHDHFWVHLVGPHFSFVGPPGCRTKCPLYTVEQKQNIKISIWCAIKCRFDATPDSNCYLKIMVLAVFGPSLNDVECVEVFTVNFLAAMFLPIHTDEIQI